MKKYILLFLILNYNFTFSQKSNEQKIDSLKIELSHAKEDTLKVKTLNRLSSKYQYIDSDLSFKYSNSALLLSQKLGYTKGIGNAYDEIGIYYWVKSDFPKALENMYKALKIHESINNKEGISGSNNGLGTVYAEFKNYKLALACYKKSLKISQDIKDQKSIATYLNNIGDVYLRMKDYQKALHYFDSAIKMNGFKKNSFDSGLNYTNLGITYNFLKQYQKSIEATNKSISIYKNDSSVYNAYNKLELGKSNYFLALEKQNTNNKNELLQKSLDFVNESMLIFKQKESLLDIRDAYLYLSKIKKEQGKYLEALDLYEKSSNINDSIFSSESKNQIALLNSQREIELRDKKIEIQKLKMNSNSRKVYLLATITISIALLFVLFFWLYISKRNKNRLLLDKNNEISNINKQKDKFFSIIAHDLRGPFNGFLGLSELLAEDLHNMTTAEIQFAAASMRSSATNLFKLLENLLEWSTMEQGLIPIVPEQQLVLPIVTESIATIKDAANNKKINFNIDIPESTTIFTDSNSIHAVIRNLLSNAVKFTPEGGAIQVHTEEEDKNTIISIKDTGIGMNKKMIDDLFKLDIQTNRTGTNNEPSTGLGLIICKEFVEKNRGKIWLESEEGKGTTFYVSLPKMKM
jgi:signal transduction histidine kinase/tetratricopeptide (TPR) repeat protein